MWTLVQHSRWVRDEDRDFEKSLEIRRVTRKSDIEVVRKAGGVLFEEYKDAMQAEEEWPFLQGENAYGVMGTFSDKKIDGHGVYIPVRIAVG